MPRIPYPYTKPRGPQVEVCDLCGRAVNSTDLFEAEVDGLQGRAICHFHGPLGTELAHRDLMDISADIAATASAEAVREQPYGMRPWWDANGGGCLILTTDGAGYLIQDTDDRNGIRLTT